MKMRRSRAGLTIVEVMVALMMLTVGVLAIMSTTAFAARTMTRGRAADRAATVAMQRMELLRASICTSRSNGADTLMRNGQRLAINSWTVTTAGNNTWNVSLVTTYAGERAKLRTLVSETAVSCVP